MRSPFSQSEAIEYRADRRIIQLRMLSAVLVMLSGLLTLTAILPIPGYMTLVVLMIFYPMHLEGKSVRERFYRWSGVLFLFALAGASLMLASQYGLDGHAGTRCRAGSSGCKRANGARLCIETPVFGNH
nr:MULTISPECIES: hypothetical protein [unclassified Exiguobacterium]